MVGLRARSVDGALPLKTATDGPGGGTFDADRRLESRQMQANHALHLTAAPLCSRTARVIEAYQARHDMVSLSHDFRSANRGVRDGCSRPSASGGGRLGC